MTGSAAPHARASSAVRRRPVRLAAAFVVACGFLAGCAGEASDGSDQTLKKITFLNTFPLENISYAPNLVASTCGYFEKQGLDVEFEATQGSAPAIQAIIAGSALLMRGADVETILAAGGKDAPIINVGTLSKGSLIRIVSSSDKPIESAKDFRGKLIGQPSAEGSSATTIDLVAGSARIAPSEVKRQVVGLTPASFELVKKGRIDAYVATLDTASILKQQEPKAVFYDPSKDISSGSQVYITSTAQARNPERQDEIRRYLAAIESAVKFMIQDEANGFAETFKCISSKYNVPTLATPEVAKQSLSVYLDSWTVDGEGTITKTNPEQWEATYREMVGAGLISDGLDASKWFTNDYVPGNR